jgi:hypothetical protein
VDIEPLRLEATEAAGDGLNVWRTSPRWSNPFRKPKSVVGAEFVAQERRELPILLQDGVFEVGAKDMMAMLDLIDHGGELAAYPG